MRTVLIIIVTGLLISSCMNVSFIATTLNQKLKNKFELRYKIKNKEFKKKYLHFKNTQREKDLILFNKKFPDCKEINYLEFICPFGTYNNLYFFTNENEGILDSIYENKILLIDTAKLFPEFIEYRRYFDDNTFSKIKKNSVIKNSELHAPIVACGKIYINKKRYKIELFYIQ